MIVNSYEVALTIRNIEVLVPILLQYPQGKPSEKLKTIMLAYKALSECLSIKDLIFAFEKAPVGSSIFYPGSVYTITKVDEESWDIKHNWVLEDDLM